MTKQEEVKLFYEFLVKKNLLFTVISNVEINEYLNTIHITQFMSRIFLKLQRLGVPFKKSRKQLVKSWTNELIKKQVI